MVGRNWFRTDKTVLSRAPERRRCASSRVDNDRLFNNLRTFRSEPSVRHSPCVEGSALSQEEYMIWVILVCVAGVWWYAWSNVRRRRKAKENTYVGA